ncbi:MAG: PadR family transcriptional regulator [Clostridiales bacterium]|nr:PadR family transcriptional regulator [Clostridiales bacterium]
MNNQFKKGVLDLCVLTILGKGDSYGYDVADTLSRKIQISDGTVYPILRKLASDGLVSTYLKESKNGPPRKYYHLTDQGREKLTLYRQEWDEFSEAVKGILEDEKT